MADTLFLHNPVLEQGGPAPVSVQCPVCHHAGLLDGVGQEIRAYPVATNQVDDHVLWFGLRRCPRPECHAAIFTVRNVNRQLVAAFPPELLDVDTTSLPAPVLASLEEAVQCHAVGCYRAAALMVRRTLEDVCAEQGVTKGNLRDKIKALGTNVVLPTALLDGLDELRLLGNDAAHIDAQTYAQVGKDELEVAIEVVKVLLLSLYQTSHLIRKLQALQNAAPATTPTKP